MCDHPFVINNIDENFEGLKPCCLGLNRHMAFVYFRAVVALVIDF
jgi:hypothetical protein